MSWGEESPCSVWAGIPCGTLAAAMRLLARLVPVGLLALVVFAPPAGSAPAAAGQSPRFGLPEPLPRPPGTIRLATYNVLNLFDHVDDPQLSGEYDDLELAISKERALNLAEAIRAVDADVVALQEVESLEALTWFRDTYLPDAGYRHLVSLDAGYRRGIECSVMSRLEITRQKVWVGASLHDVERRGAGWAAVPPPARRSLTFQRSPLRVDLRTPGGYELTIFCVHHKSGRDFRFQREAEALKIVEIVRAVEQEDPSRNILVMGDFNAAPWDKSLRVYLESGLVDTLAHRTVRGEEGSLYKTHQSNRVLDYILLNSAAHRELWIGSPHVYGTPGPRRRNDPQASGFASDHFPVVIDMVPRDRL